MSSDKFAINWCQVFLCHSQKLHMFRHKGPLESQFLKQSHTRAIPGDTGEEFNVLGVVVVGGRESVDVVDKQTKNIVSGSGGIITIVGRQSKGFIVLIEYRKVTV